MIEVTIPGFGHLTIKSVLFDMNGTLSVDGKIEETTKDRLINLAKHCSLFVITADTFGTAADVFKELPLTLKILSGEAAPQKKIFLDELGADTTVTMGNGNNDRIMLREARIGICIIGQEGASTGSLTASDIAVSSIDDALDLLLFPNRLKATLRT